MNDVMIIHSQESVTPDPHLSSDSPKLIKGLVAIQKMVKEISKEGWNKDGKYGFIQVADVYASIQDASAANGLIISPREISRRIVQKILEVTYAFDVWADNNEYIRNWAVVTGACRFEFKSGSTDDKALNKTLTAAMKGMLIAAFKIPSDDATVERAFDGDPDSQPNSDTGWRDRPRDDRGRGDRPRDDRPVEERARNSYWADRTSPDKTRPDDEVSTSRRGDPISEEDAPRGRSSERVDRDGITHGPPADRERDARGSRSSDPRDDIPPPEDDRRPSRDADRRPAAEEPAAGDDDLRTRVMRFTRKLRNAADLKEAQTVWALDGRDVLQEMSDATYEFLRTEFNDRWNEWPA